MSLLQTAYDRASPGGARGRLSTLVFHRVLAQPDPIFPDEIDAERFDRLCGWIAALFNVLPLDEAARRLADGSLPPRAMAISFDDGYLDNHQTAVPILRRHGLCATFFIATGFLDGGRMWNDTVIEALRATRLASLDLGDLGRHDLPDNAARRRAIEALIDRVKYLPPAQRQVAVDRIAERAQAALPDDLMMGAQQLREMRQAGMQIGAHTVSHPILARLDDAAARLEIAESRQTLQALLGEPVTLFAYPNGRPGEDYTARSVAIVRSLGFTAAVTTAWGAAHRRSDPFELPRFTPWDLTRWRFNGRLLANLWRSRP